MGSRCCRTRASGIGSLLWSPDTVLYAVTYTLIMALVEAARAQVSGDFGNVSVARDGGPMTAVSAEHVWIPLNIMHQTTASVSEEVIQTFVGEMWD